MLCRRVTRIYAGFSNLLFNDRFQDEKDSVAKPDAYGRLRNQIRRVPADLQSYDLFCEPLFYWMQA